MLNYIFTEIKSKVPESHKLYSDLPGKTINNSVIPADILVTRGEGSKPGLVIISRKYKKIALFELSCPLERNLQKAHDFKQNKYSGMETDLEDKG